VTACACINMEWCTWGWQFTLKHWFRVEAFIVLGHYAAVVRTLCCKSEIS